MGEIVLSENKGEEIPEILEERETDFQIEKIEIYKRMNRLAEAGGILFAGSSLMENFPIYEFAQGRISKKLYNRGVGGYTMADFIRHIDTLVFDLSPEKMFINIGSNDLSRAEYSIEKLCAQYKTILDRIRVRMPETKVFVMAFYPMNELVGGESVFGMRSNARICEANVALKALVTEYTDYRFIDVNACLYDEERRLKAEWAIDGIHMYPEAYAAVFEELLPFFE